MIYLIYFILIIFGIFLFLSFKKEKKYEQFNGSKNMELKENILSLKNKVEELNTPDVMNEKLFQKLYDDFTIEKDWKLSEGILEHPEQPCFTKISNDEKEIIMNTTFNKKMTACVYIRDINSTEKIEVRLSEQQAEQLYVEMIKQAKHLVETDLKFQDKYNKEKVESLLENSLYKTPIQVAQMRMKGEKQ